LATAVSTVSHAELAKYGAEVVNLPPEDARNYRDQANRMRERLEQKINADPSFALVKMLNSGSVAKGTALSTIGDMDVAVYVTSAAAPQTERDLVIWLRDRLKETYPKLDDDQFIVCDHCVKLKFRTTTYVDIDAVPVLYEGEADNVGYLIVSDTGERVHTSISRHLDFIRARKKAIPDDFAQVVRLCKWWSGNQKALDPDFRLKSFMVELICAHLADIGTDFSDYCEAMSSFFVYIVKSGLTERIAFGDYYAASEMPTSTSAPIEILDPVNHANNVATTYTTTDRTRIVTAATDALEAIADAAYATTKGRAVEDWQVVFGSTFRV
jgi:hypothetical protein